MQTYVIFSTYTRQDSFSKTSAKGWIINQKETIVAFTTTFLEMNFTGSILWKLEP